MSVNTLFDNPILLNELAKAIPPTGNIGNMRLLSTF